MLAIDADLVRALVAEQFPHWRALPVTPVPRSGHDNRTFRLGETMSVRLPSAEAYAAHVAVEYKWLPELAPALPLAIPKPLALGAPGSGYPWPWTVNEWIPADATAAAGVQDLERLAGDLARFLTALQQIDARRGPAPGPHNFHRGGELAIYRDDTEACLEELDGHVDAAAARAVWRRALESRWEEAPRWLHGDVAPDNLLVSNDRLKAVIDFGQLAAGDPACDLTMAWTCFDAPSRSTFQRALALDDATWARARGWALWKALLRLRDARRGDLPDLADRLQLVELLLES